MTTFLEELTCMSERMSSEAISSVLLDERGILIDRAKKEPPSIELLQALQTCSAAGLEAKRRIHAQRSEMARESALLDHEQRMLGCFLESARATQAGEPAVIDCVG